MAQKLYGSVAFTQKAQLIHHILNLLTLNKGVNFTGSIYMQGPKLLDGNWLSCGVQSKEQTAYSF